MGVCFHNKSSLNHFIKIYFCHTVLPLLVVCSFCLVPSVSIAQQKNFVNRTIDFAYRIVQGDSAKPHKRYLFIIPFFAYKPETRWMGGISATHYFRMSADRESTRPSFVRLNTSYSQERQFSVRPQMELFTRNNRFNIRAQYTYTDFAEYFWGLGIASANENRELYSFNMNRGFIKAAYLILPKLYTGVQYNFEYMRDLGYATDSKLKQSNYTGNKGYFASGAGLTMYYDSRDNIYFPFKGSYIEFSNYVYAKITGSDYSFSNFSVDARHYHRLWKQNILAFQLYTQFNEGNIPFRMNGNLGSEFYLRGYYNGRYRDNHAWSFQTELRKTVWGPIDMTAFMGVGTVAHDVTDLTKSLKPAGGLGIRIKAIPRERINMRIDYAIGVDGSRATYITMNEAF